MAHGHPGHVVRLPISMLLRQPQHYRNQGQQSQNSSLTPFFRVSDSKSGNYINDFKFEISVVHKE